MKRPVLITIPPVQPVKFTNASPMKYYGVQLEAAYPDETDARGFITAETENKDRYVVRSVESGFTNSERWGAASYTGVNLIALIENCIRSDSPVYEFDTFRELSEWLNGDEKK